MYETPGKNVASVRFCTTGYWDNVIHLEFRAKQVIMDAKYYSPLLKGAMLNTITRKGSRILERHVIVLHDNIRPYPAYLTVTTLGNLRLEILAHALYSPDLTNIIFTCPGPSKSSLNGKKFRQINFYRNKNIVQWLLQHPISFYPKGINELSKQ